jgi:MscS family membrane protein
VAEKSAASNDFMQQVYFDNTVEDLLVTVAIIISVIILNRLVSRYLSGLIFSVVKRSAKNLDRKEFIDLIIHPVGMLLVFFVSIAALHKLTFPGVWNLYIYRYSIKDILHASATIVLIATFIWFLLRLIDFIALVLHRRASLTADQGHDQLIVFFRDFFKVILALIGVLLILHFAFDFAIGNLLTGLSIVGAAIALSLKESLENLIASFVIFFDKPFTTGDLVKVQNITGTIKKIGLRSTRLRTDQKTYVTVPNKQMVDSILDNLSLRTQRKGELRLELASNTPADKLQNFVTGVKKILTVKEIENSTVLLDSISKNSIMVNGDYFTGAITVDEFNAVKEKINFAVLQLMEDLEAKVAGPDTQVQIIHAGSNQ